MPIEASGRRSRRRTIQNKRPAQANMVASRARVRATPGCGARAWKSCETAMSENKEIQRPIQVARLDATGRRGCARGIAFAEVTLFMESGYECWGTIVPFGARPSR